MFEKARSREPKTGWKWADMVAAAKKLTKDKDGDGKIDEYGLGVEASIIRARAVRLVERRRASSTTTRTRRA